MTRYKYFSFNALFVFIIKIFFLQCNNFYPIWIFFLQCNIFQPGCWVTGTGWGCSLCRCTWCSCCCTPPSQRVRGGWWARAGWARPLLSSTPSGTDLLRLTHSDSSFPAFNWTRCDWFEEKAISALYLLQLNLFDLQEMQQPRSHWEAGE